MFRIAFLKCCMRKKKKCTLTQFYLALDVIGADFTLPCLEAAVRVTANLALCKFANKTVSSSGILR